MSSNSIKKKLLLAGKILLGLLLLCLFALIIFVVFYLPGYTPPGADDVPPFSHDNNMGIERNTPDGIPYTVNNSTATFKLDVTESDEHCELVFTNYASALKYCQKNGLATIPSVQLVQGKLKSFDDALSATLELAMVERRNRMLTHLLKSLKRSGSSEAVVHVVTALSLAGLHSDVEPELVIKVQIARNKFLGTPESRPIGFWDGNDQLRRNFQSDRFLMQGFHLHESPEACIAISRAIMEDEKLRSEAKYIWSFGSKLTNPSSTVAVEQLAKLTPEQVRQRFPGDAKFALIAYSVSKENALIDLCVRERLVSPDTNLMALIIDAVRSGKLSLEPKLASGWYDYQLYALETLLCPERGMESAKLHLSQEYKKRLENAFTSVLTKQRETHIKRLPETYLGCMDDDESPPKVRLSPEFSAEPTLTVYLRLGRGYCFLRQTMTALLGEEELSKINLPGSVCAVDKELRKMEQFCYGLYEQLCLEIGLLPEYLPGEMSEDDRKQAVAVFDAWSRNWQSDPVLADDTRVAVPIGHWRPDGGPPIYYWGTAGIRLEAVEYKYLDEPYVKGRIEPEFVSCKLYLLTDLFYEFKRSSPERLTRAEFRSICDSVVDLPSLRQALGLGPAETVKAEALGISNWFSSKWGWGILVIVVLLYKKVRRARLWLILGSVVLVSSWAILFFSSPYYRTKFLVRHVAPANDIFGMLCEHRIASADSEAPRVKALSELLSDPDAQIRYLAARFMAYHERGGCTDDNSVWFQDGIKEKLMQAADDPNPEIATLAMFSLSIYRDRDVTDLLIKKLKENQHYEFMTFRVLSVLGEIGDPRAIEVILPFCEDSRTYIRFYAFNALGQFSHPDALKHLLQFSESPDPNTRFWALRTIASNYHRWCDVEEEEAEVWRLKCDQMLIGRLQKKSLPFEVQVSLAKVIKNEQMMLDANAIMLESAGSSSQTNAILIVATDHFLKDAIYYVDQRENWMKIRAVVTNSTQRLELAHAVKSKRSDAVHRSLESILKQAASDPDASTSSLAQNILKVLQKEKDGNSQRCRKHRR